MKVTIKRKKGSESVLGLGVIGISMVTLSILLGTVFSTVQKITSQTPLSNEINFSTFLSGTSDVKSLSDLQKQMKELENYLK